MCDLFSLQYEGEVFKIDSMFTLREPFAEMTLRGHKGKENRPRRMKIIDKTIDVKGANYHACRNCPDCRAFWDSGCPSCPVIALNRLETLMFAQF